MVLALADALDLAPMTAARLQVAIDDVCACWPHCLQHDLAASLCILSSSHSHLQASPVAFCGITCLYFRHWRIIMTNIASITCILCIITLACQQSTPMLAIDGYTDQLLGGYHWAQFAMFNIRLENWHSLLHCRMGSDLVLQSSWRNSLFVSTPHCFVFCRFGATRPYERKRVEQPVSLSIMDRSQARTTELYPHADVLAQ